MQSKILILDFPHFRWQRFYKITLDGSRACDIPPLHQADEGFLFLLFFRHRMLYLCPFRLEIESLPVGIFMTG